MAHRTYPKFFSDCITTHEEAMNKLVVSGVRLGSGFAVSEPYRFYHDLWDHIQREDLTDISIRQSMFMGPHRLCVGDALRAAGMFGGVAKNAPGFLKGVVRQADAATKKIDGLRKLIEHFRELEERRIHFVSPFMGPAENMVIPDNRLTRLLAPEYVGRNRSRMAFADMQIVHFPDGVAAMARDAQGNPLYDVLVLVMTPPNAEGYLSHGPGNGGNGAMLAMSLDDERVKILLYVNQTYPFTYGYNEASNHEHIDHFKSAARQGRLTVVLDDTPAPALPAGSMDHPSTDELAIAENVVNHMEVYREFTYGRAIQVGIGATGVLAIKKLLDSGWTGRSYTEMLEPFTYKLYEAGKIQGSHFIELDGRRTELDGKMVCTFTMGEQGSDFYQKLHENKNVIIAASRRVVIPEAFYGGLGINNILSLDFQGHVNSGGRDKNTYSGIGGAAMIIRGLAQGGVSYLCLKSTHRTPEGKLRSSIFPFLPTGTPISVIGPDIFGTRDNAATFLATEHGVAQINARTQGEYIRQIISVADPRFRDALKKAAWEELRVRV